MALLLPSLKKSGHLDRLFMTVAVVGSRAEEANYAAGRWDLFAPHLAIYGFEADVVACESLNKKIQAENLNWTEKHFPLTLWHKPEKRTLYVTEYPHCTSLYPPNEVYTSRFIGASTQLRLVSTLEVETTTLDAFCQSEGIQEIDFLQIDVQGAELNVLQGAEWILGRSILACECEVEFIEVYANQPLFGDVDVFLRKAGFTLSDFTGVYRNTRRGIPIVSNNHPGVLSWSQDAFYFPDLLRIDQNHHLRTPDRLLKLACIADLLEFPDYALELLVYLTERYGDHPQYNFANNIVESLQQLPNLTAAELNSWPIMVKLKPYITRPL